MKRHRGWLAAGLVLFAVLACNVSKNTNNSNNSNNSNSNKNSNSSTSTRPANAEVYIEQIEMAKDKNGEPGEATTSFSPDERTVHSVIHLNKAKAGTKIKFSWIAVNADPFPKDYEIKSFEYATNSFEKDVHGHLTYSLDWPKGTYRVEVYINGALDKTISYTVE